MFEKKSFKTTVIQFALALAAAGCGGQAAAPPKSAEQETGNEDPISDLVGNVDESDIAEADAENKTEQAYAGPTKLTVELKVVNESNPKGSFKVIDANGNNAVENGEFGKQFELAQGAYSIEFASPMVFGGPTYLVEKVQVQGEQMSVKETFPAGQFTLHTYKRKPEEKCKPVAFSVKSITEEKELPGKGKSCEPIVLSPGTYELLLDVSNRVVQPVQIMVSSEQVSSASVKLEK